MIRTEIVNNICAQHTENRKIHFMMRNFVNIFVCVCKKLENEKTKHPLEIYNSKTNITESMKNDIFYCTEKPNIIKSIIIISITTLFKTQNT